MDMRRIGLATLKYVMPLKMRPKKRVGPDKRPNLQSGETKVGRMRPAVTAELGPCVAIPVANSMLLSES